MEEFVPVRIKYTYDVCGKKEREERYKAYLEACDRNDRLPTYQECLDEEDR